MTAPLHGVGAAYDDSAQAWAEGPAAAYESMADALLGRAPCPVLGATVLDIGAGTGSAARAARRAGAGRVVGIDLAAGMLRAGSGWDQVVVGDAAALPFEDATFDLAVAACCLGHLPAPGAALVETRRVARTLVASAFSRGWTHPAKAAVDAVAAAYGFLVPAWYARLKAELEPAVDDAATLVALARAAGFTAVEVVVTAVDVGARTPRQLAEWRLGMAHLAPFVASLDSEHRRQLRTACEQALTGCPPLVVPMLALAAS